MIIRQGDYNYMKMRGIWALLVLNLGLLANCAEPNYEDFMSALEQPQGEIVEVRVRRGTSV